MDADGDDLLRVREFAREQAAIAAEYKMRYLHLNKENIRLRRRLGKVYGSWTWRVGRIVLFPYHLARGLADWVRHRRAPV